MRTPTLVVLLALTPLSALAQTPSSDPCASFTWPVTEAKAALSRALKTIPSGGAAPSDFELTLTPTEGVSYPVKPERKPKKAGTFGGYVNVDAPQAKLFQVTLSDEAWVDVAQGGALVKSSAFSGKGGCEGVRKVVRFALTGSGPVTVQVSGAETQSIRIDVRGVD